MPEPSRFDLPWLNMNHITNIEARTFEGLLNLYDLYLGHNEITNIGAQAFEGLSNLDELYLDYNEITNIEAQTFQGLSNLDKLYLDQNEITNIGAQAFEGLSNLGELYLNNNEITKIEALAFEGLSQLVKLWLNNNSIRDIEAHAFEGLSNLDVLRLNMNAITKIEAHVFERLSNLFLLTLHKNAITSIEAQAFKGLSKLNTLYLDNNTITNTEAHAFEGLSNLDELWLGQNAITSIGARAFEGMSNLNTLHLDYNSITNIEAQAFEGLSKLKILQLDTNIITNIVARAFDGLSNLIVLRLPNNGITDIAAQRFKGLSNLKKLYLHKNAITNIEAHAFEGLANLNKLGLGNNAITNIKAQAFEGLSNLLTLWLDNNIITNIQAQLFEGVANLLELYLYNNAITNIEAHAFKGLSNLDELDLHNNFIANIELQAFESLSNLDELSLSNNSMNILKARTFEGLPKLTVLNLASNFIASVEGGINELLFHICTVKLYFNPNPLYCVPTNRSLRGMCPIKGINVTCKCGGGYLMNETAANETGFISCYRPTFTLNPNHNTLVSALTNIVQSKPIYHGQPLFSTASTQLTSVSKRELFVGYSDKGFGSDAISFELKFKGGNFVDITCGETKVGDTLAEGTIDSWNNDYLGYITFTSRETLLKFIVTKNHSTFTFDGCDSRFPASLGVYNLNDSTKTLLTSKGKKPFKPVEATCTLSSAAIFTTPPLDVGTYILMIQAQKKDDANAGGIYEVRMKCENGSDSAELRDVADPGGIGVNSITGELFGEPQKNGTYEVDFNAIDSDGNTATLASWNFAVEDVPPLGLSGEPFSVLLKDGSSELLQQLTVDVTYRFTVAGNITDYINNTLGSVSYRLDIDSASDAATDDVLINTKTGTFQATPTEPYNATVQIVAVDGGGVDREVVLQTWTFVAVPQELLQLQFPGTFEPQLSPNNEHENGSVIMLLNQTITGTYRYTISGNITDYVTNNLGDLSYGLSVDSDSVDATNDILINTNTGALQVSPTSQYSATVQIIAVDSGGTGRAIVLKNWTFDALPADYKDTFNGPNHKACANGGTVTDSVLYDHHFTCACTQRFFGENCETLDAFPQLSVTVNETEHDDLINIKDFTSVNRTQWAIDATYRVAAVAVGSANYTPSTGDVVSVHKENVTFVLDNGPPGFFIDGNTGELLGKPTRTIPKTISTLYATSIDTTKAKLREFSFEFLPSDVSENANGPNGKGCGGNGVAVDTIEFDAHFTCECNDGILGDNCDQQVLIGTFVSIVVIAIAIIIVWRVQVYRLKHRPIDMDAIQTQLLADLGLGAIARMKDTEVGVTLTISPKEDRSVELEGQALTSFERMLLEAAAVPLHISARDAWVQSGPSPVRVFVVVFTKPPGFDTESFKHDVRCMVHSMQKSGSSSINGMEVTSAAVAVPRRTPREISRNKLLRIDVIGHGNSSDVFKGVLSEGHHGNAMKLIVAVKTCHTSSTNTAEAQGNMLKEAALMALFDHRNVLPLIGIVTTPRDLPVLLVLSYCDNGSLLDYLLTQKQEVSIPSKLTICAEVARGLEYISSRRVIHRDVAARNILLDISLVCKIADFGMATSLNEAKEYTRLDNDDDDENDKLPVRWLAPEVLVEGKFSVQTDVWAFGVLAWEVFSNGTTPHEGHTLLEVIDAIRNHKVLSMPASNAFPHDIYDQLMASCFAKDPTLRPTFVELYDCAVHLGASEDDIAIEEHHRQRQTSLLSSIVVNLTDGEMLERQGPSVHHLSTTFVTKTLEAVQTQLGSSTDLHYPTDAKIYHMVRTYAKPAGLQHTCPRDNQPGAAYVDTLHGEDDVGVATALLSYSWGYKVQDVVAALVEWTEKEERDPKRTYIWICSLCLNQHRIIAALTPDQLAKEFGERVTAIGLVLPMLEDWQDPGYVKRAWCLFELYTAIRMKSVQVDIILTPSQRLSCANAIKTNGFRVIDQALDKVKSEKATASEKADLEAIKTLIERYQGGYTALNEAVKVRLRSWFQTIAGIQFSRSTPIVATNPNIRRGKSDMVSLKGIEAIVAKKKRTHVVLQTVHKQFVI